ncbi:hypothetical protein BC941DRAFT_419206 [Chlamydoabsidia padenii]|nr:hypothetical protein BC941DRAFT_419206 [Chlamydoabsidia padenii]
MESTPSIDETQSKTYWESLKDKHQMDIFGTQDGHDTSVLYSVPWSNPSTYSCNKALTISKKYDLPTILKELVAEKGFIRMNMSTRSKYILMTTKTNAGVSLHFKEKDCQDLKKLEFKLPLPLPTQIEPPFIDLILPSLTDMKPTILENNADSGIVVVTKTGHLLYWPNIKDAAIHNTATYQTHQLPLGFKEEVTCTAANLFNGSLYQLAIGTSIGNVYLVQLVDTQGQVAISETSLYRKTISSTMIGSFWSYLSSSSSSGKEDLNIGGIIKIIQGHSRNEIIVLSTLYIQSWVLSSSRKATMTSRTNLHSAIQQHAIPTLLPKNLTPNMKVDLLDMDKYGQSGWAVLVSYTIPEMGDFAQFALVCMNQLPKEQDNNMPFQLLQSYSLPYSIILSRLERQPTLHMSDGSIAYVSFDNTVISIAVTPNSLYEHALVLRQDINGDNQQIISTIVKEHDDDDDGTWTTGLIFTTGNDVLEYKINQISITESQSEGNVYATDYEDEKTRELALVRSKLEQAVFFGYNDENPLYFPVRSEQQFEIGDTVVSLAKDIITGESGLTPITLDIRVSLEQRLKFARRLPDILKNEKLLDLVDTKSWINLWSILESCYIGIELLNFIDQERTNNVDLVKYIDLCLENASKALRNQVDPETVDYNRHDILSHHILLLPKTLENMTATSLNMVKDVASFILHIVSHIHPLEQAFVREYVITMKRGDISSFLSASRAVAILHKLFLKLKASMESSYDETLDISGELLMDTLAKCGDLILTIDRENTQMDSRLHHRYEQQKQQITDTLWNLGMKDIAMSLAVTHEYYPTLVTYAHNQSPKQCQQLVDQYIQTYGVGFVRSLLQFYSDNDDEDRLLHFDPTYEKVVSEILQQNLSIGWKYHLQKGNFEDVFKSLQILIPTIENISKKKILLSQAKLAYLTVNTLAMDNTLISTVLESDQMIRLNIELELMESQEQTLSKLKIILNDYASKSDTERVNLTVKRVSSLLIDKEFTEEVEIMKHLTGRLLLGHALNCDEYVMLLSLMDNNGPNIDNYLSALYFTRIFSTDDNKEQTATNLNSVWKSIYTIDDWSTIDQYVKKRDNADLFKILNQTTMYRVLLMCKKQGVVDESILRPGDIQLDQLSSRDKLLAESIGSHRLDTYFDESICAISL